MPSDVLLINDALRNILHITIVLTTASINLTAINENKRLSFGLIICAKLSLDHYCNMNDVLASSYSLNLRQQDADVLKFLQFLQLYLHEYLLF